MKRVPVREEKGLVGSVMVGTGAAARREASTASHTVLSSTWWEGSAVSFSLVLMPTFLPGKRLA